VPLVHDRCFDDHLLLITHRWRRMKCSGVSMINLCSVSSSNLSIAEARELGGAEPL
jgi:hypothetical protein